MKNLIKLIALCLIPVAAWGQNIVIRNDGASTTLTGTNLDPGALAVSSKGELFCTAGTAAASLGKAEDAAHASGDVGVMSLAVYRSSFTNSVSTAGDYATLIVDGDGRLAVNAQGAAAGSTWQACSGSITNTTQTDIKAAVASNRIYVTSIGCNNTATVASTLVFGDGASAIWQGAIGNSTLNGVAGYTMTFPVPLRTTANTAFTVTLGTTATATRCCAAGYISVN